MKIKIWVLAVVLAFSATAHAATNDLTGLLQQGLFEEEANRNLDAAIASYQSLASAFDKDRQLAATAIFRLGECYRKLGKTNEAVVQYQRIVKEFSDQQILVNLSRQNLAGLNAAEQTEYHGQLQATLLDARANLATLQAQLQEIEHMSHDEKRIFVQQNYPNSVLTESMTQLVNAERDLIKLKMDFAPDHPKYQNAQELVDNLNAKVDAQVNGAVQGLRDKLSATQVQLQLLQKRLQEFGGSQLSVTPSSNPIVAEQRRQLDRVKKLQAMPLSEILQDGPTLLTDATLINLIYQYNQTDLDLVRLKTDHAEEHPDVKKAKAMETALADKIKERLDGLVRALALEIGNSPTTAGDSFGGTSESATTDEEQTQIRNIQAMIQNSPDLINAPTAVESGYRTPLEFAAEKGQLIVAKYLLDHGADVNGAVRTGTPAPLYLAANNGHKAMVELLLVHGADVNGARGPSPLNVAVSKGFTGVVDVLLANKADVNAWGDNSGKVLHTAVSTGNTNFIQLLIAHGADVNATDSSSNTPLHLAASQNKPELVRILLAAKSDVDARDKEGNTPLHQASERGFEKVVSLLLDSGASVDVTNYHNATPLLFAVNAGRVEATRVLLEHKADPNHIGQVKWGNQYSPPSPPIYIALIRNSDVLKLLLDAGANANGDPVMQRPPIFTAIEIKVPKSVQLLLEHGADPNAKDTQGLTPLFDTTNPELARLLVEHKADLNARDRNGGTPILRATGDGAANFIKILVEAGAKTDLQDTNGNTALHYAVYNLKPEPVAILLEHKANPNVQNDEGFTPLDLAKGGSNRRLMLGVDSQNNFGNFFGSFNNFAPTEVEQKIIDLLVNAGGLANLPKRDRIEVRRASNTAWTIYKDSSGHNRYSLLESIAMIYGLLSQDGSGEWRLQEESRPKLLGGLRFPDFKQVTIYRRANNSGKQSTTKINVDEILNSGDCSRDVWLDWGDIVEIPELDHPVDEKWDGLTDEPATALIKCIARRVTIKVKGETTALNLAPELLATTIYGGGGARMIRLSRASFVLRSVLDNSKLIRVSSDLSRVKVTRRDPITKKEMEWTLDCTSPNSQSLWLRDGDVIEVPEK